MYKHCIVLAIGAMLFATAGCGSDLPAVNVVTGTVIYDGKPLVGAKVAYHPEEGNATASRAASGETDASGKFTLKMNFADGNTVVVLEGAPTGNYRVTVTKLETTTNFEGTGTDPTSGDGDGESSVNDEYMKAMGSMTEGGSGPPQDKSLISDKFRFPYQTPLTAEVGDGENTFTIDLKSNGQGTVSGSVN